MVEQKKKNDERRRGALSLALIFIHFLQNVFRKYCVEAIDILENIYPLFNVIFIKFWPLFLQTFYTTYCVEVG